MSELSLPKGTIIVTYGVPGSGKTTIVNKLSEFLKIPKSNESLQKMMENESKTVEEIHFEHDRIEFAKYDALSQTGNTIILDTVLFFACPAAKLLCELGFDTDKHYKYIFEHSENFINEHRKPNVILYMRTDPDITYKRSIERDGGADKKFTTYESMKTLFNYVDEYAKNNLCKKYLVIEITNNEYKNEADVVKFILENLNKENGYIKFT